MAKKKASDTGPNSGRSAGEPDPTTPSAGPDLEKEIRGIVARSAVPLTLKQIHARHGKSSGSARPAESIEDSVLSMLRSSKLGLVRTGRARTMMLSLDAVSALISDDPEVAIPQLLCLPPRLPMTNREIFDRLTRDFGKTNMSRGAVDGALEALYLRKAIRRSDVDEKYSCDCP